MAMIAPSAPRPGRLVLVLPRALLPSLSFALSALALAAPARAQQGRIFGSEDTPPQGSPTGPRVVMRLDYAAAEGCPDDQVFRDAVAARVRWGAFAPNAPWRLSIRIVRRGAGYEGSAELRNLAGAVEWSRALPATTRCLDAIENAALALALKIDPPRPPERDREPPSSPSLVSPPLAPPSNDVDRAHAEPRKPSSAVFRIGAAMWIDLATSPRPAAAVSLDVGFRVAWFSLAIEGRAMPPASANVGDAGVEISAARYTGALLPCGHVSWFVGCVVAELGALQGTLRGAGATAPERTTLLYAAGGARLGVEIPVIPSRLFVRLAANLLGARKSVFRLDNAPVWETAAFVGGFGVGLNATF